MTNTIGVLVSIGLLAVGVMGIIGLYLYMSSRITFAVALGAAQSGSLKPNTDKEDLTDYEEYGLFDTMRSFKNQVFKGYYERRGNIALGHFVVYSARGTLQVEVIDGLVTEWARNGVKEKLERLTEEDQHYILETMKLLHEANERFQSATQQ